MAAQVSTLCEVLWAVRTRERSLPRVLAEVVAQVAAFFEHGVTVFVLAPIIQLHALLLVALLVHFDRLVPSPRHVVKSLALLVQTCPGIWVVFCGVPLRRTHLSLGVELRLLSRFQNGSNIDPAILTANLEQILRVISAELIINFLMAIWSVNKICAFGLRLSLCRFPCQGSRFNY